MVLSAGPVYKPQYRMQGLPQCTPHLVLRSWRIQRLDVQRFPLVGTWETCVLIVTRSPTADDRCPTCEAGSGKSVLWSVVSQPLSPATVLILILSAAIIQHIMTLSDSGSATLTYFYFDFRDEEKQNVRNAVTSILVQLSASSKHCCDTLYRLYSAHGKGTRQPSDGTLIDRLKEMLTVTARQKPIFVVMDALDECPGDGTPTPREGVLNLVTVLVRLQLPNLHICVTSRPEIDIQTMLKPLAVNAISLHEEAKQTLVIANYVNSVVSSDVRMRNWRDEDKKLVVEELSERADGM